MCEGPGSINEDNIGCQQHYDDAVAQSDQAAAPLGPPLTEGTAEQKVETQPANQAADHLQYWHGRLRGMIELNSASQNEFTSSACCPFLHHVSITALRIYLGGIYK